MISIIMPVKNAMPYLTECLQSIINQTFQNWELIAINDNSNDDSSHTLIKFSQFDKRINVFENDGNGIISALKTGYKHSNGKYITRMDADDLMPTYKLEKMYSTLIKFPKTTLVTGYVKYFSENGIGPGFDRYEKWLNKLVDNNLHHKEIYKECVIPSPCWLTTREAFEIAGGFDSNIYPEDYDLTFRFHLSGIKFVGIKDTLHLWRDHQKRTSRTHEHYAVNSFLHLKISYFLKLNYNSDKKLVVWGAGKKGKVIARLLIENDIQFEWVCNNPNKIGISLLGKTWRDSKNWFKKSENYQCICIVSKPQDQELIKKQITLHTNIESFWFC